MLDQLPGEVSGPVLCDGQELSTTCVSIIERRLVAVSDRGLFGEGSLSTGCTPDETMTFRTFGNDVSWVESRQGGGHEF
jgi:hypothetical protein